MSRIKNFVRKVFTKINTASIEREKSSNMAVKGAYGAFGAVTAIAVASPATFAIKNIFDKFKDALSNLYDNFITISVAAVATVTAGCLLTRLIAKNPRTVEMATEWMKRAWIAFLLLNLIKVIITYIQELAGVKDGAGPEKPW